ncbi:MAG: alpha/beta hydrolase [Promethearchaeota archaeon]
MIIQKNILSKFRNCVNVRNLSIFSFNLNSFCIVLGIIYLIIPTYTHLWDIFGILLSITLFENLFLAYLTSVRVNKSTKLGNRINFICYINMLFTIMAYLCMIIGNLLLSSSFSYRLIDNLGAFTIINFCFFGILVFALSISVINIKNIKNKTLWSLSKKVKSIQNLRTFRIKKSLRRILTILTRFTFIIGILFGIVIVFGSFEILTTFIAIISAQFGIFFSLIFFANTLLFLKLKGSKLNRKKFVRNAITGTLVSFLLVMPLALTNITIYNAEKNFTATFGEGWKTNIPTEVEQYFLKTPFTTPSYFLGIQTKECLIERNILFYSGEGINLYFDAYMPLGGGESLPGQNTVIIRIHGGSWIMGDKGTFNMLEMNKYFAAQGYVVFDIQYGLRDSIITPKYKAGDFNVDDMVRHIGIFTKYLSNHSVEYGANLDSVFFSGGSAGGHLTCAVSLAATCGTYPDLFSPDLNIRGYIPFYPANGLLNFFGISGKEEFLNPEMMIESNSPPCLIFQGTHDIINYFGIVNTIKNTYLAQGNRECSIIWMLLGGHACDFYFSGYYNQIFLYYMERFLYLYH